ncbi:hypothetical protein GCM10008995_13930 [Halobellus salinus]|uniref:LVIVD repeat-containing protein n=1 Tax=Halobellus salinus TaxID=931585 RepID=A0A830EPT2_9EURY|nr:hypothetical protein [Halobellus salinus]GGJ05308.1 hypothetical protein GCM10008995_13930 [Halobellus salinus]SMP23215.1 LVIVD repeat-containing protein [Halobellus salinus]
MRRRRFLRGVGSGFGTAAGVAVGGRASTRRVAAHPGPYEPYGSIDVAGAREAVVDPDGDVAYLATTTGYATVDVSAPDRPELLADVRDPLTDREGGPLRGIFDAKLDATDPTTLVVAGPANPLRGAVSGILVVDVSDSARPDEVVFHATDGPVHNCFVRDGLAYITGNDGGRNPVVIVDLGTGTEVGRWSVTDVADAWAAVPSGLRSVHDVYVAGDTAFVALWDAGTWLLDVSDPADPTVRGRVDVPDPEPLADLSESAVRRRATLPPGNHHYVATDESGTLLGVGRESWGRRVDQNATATPAADVTATDSGPAPGTAAPLSAGADAKFVGGPSGIDLWDVSDPAEPVPRATVPAPASPDPTYGGVWTTAHNFELSGEVLYSSWYRGGVKRHDVSEPSTPKELSWWRDPETASFWTARLAAPGERDGFFVASSWGVDDVAAGLYTFPDHAGEQADPPGVLPSGTATPRPRYETATRTPERSATTTAPETAVGGGIGAPGFGVAAAVGGVALATWRLLCRAEERK